LVMSAFIALAISCNGKEESADSVCAPENGPFTLEIDNPYLPFEVGAIHVFEGIEAGEHFTPREVIELMTHIIFDPIKDKLPPVMKIYDPACGSGGMLTESEKFIKDEAGDIRATGDVYLYG